MENRQILIAFVLLLLCLPLAAFAAEKEVEPTAIVIDAETGKPVEGAVALAQFFRPVSLGLGLGGSLALEKAQETFSDKDGRIYLPDFWEWEKSFWKNNPKPRLNVYKPGYVIWDNQEICPVYVERTDFDKKHRTVKLLKFETEAARWLKEKYDVGRGGPHVMQDSFFLHCYSTENISQIKFQEIFYKYESPFIKKEEMEIYNKLYKK